MITFKRKILHNGLIIIAHRDTTTPMAAVNILYKVGSRNENPEQTGFAHLFEHLMFQGSKNVPDFDTPIQIAGGENNAFTNSDFTNYYIALPTSNLETALWVESDRMASLNCTETALEVQRKVVIEEFSQRYLNQPYGDTWLMLKPLCYKVHPYQWATIGKDISHIQNATLEQVQQFYTKHYQPCNAILTIAADMPEEQIITMAEKWFKDIPSKDIPSDKIPVEPPQTKQQRLTVKKDVPTDIIYMAFHMAERHTKEFSICDVISDILSNGTSSRLYQRLVKEQNIFSSINAYVSGDMDKGLFIVTAQLLGTTNIEQAEKALWKQLTILQTDPVQDYELQKVKNKFEATNIFTSLNILNKAMNLSFFENLGDANLINQEVAEHSAVTKQEILNTAKKIFQTQNSNVLHYLSNKK